MAYKKIIIGNKRGMEIPFSWLFAIIAGAFIILIAVAATVRIINNGQQTVESESAQQLGNMLNPIVTGLSSAYATHIDLTKETRVYDYCYETSDKSPVFGRQAIAMAEQSGFLNRDWTAVSMNISRYNKFVFSENMEQGKKLYLFAEPFYAGFKVDDIITMNAGKYCFTRAPQNVEDSLKMLKVGNINFTANADLCKNDEIIVCFGARSGGTKCNISVVGDCNDDSCSQEMGSFERGYVEKEGQSLPYYGSLIYAAISSSPEIYTCNLKRLAAKTSELAGIYKDKIEIMKIKGCSSVISGFLDQIIASSQKITQGNLAGLYEIRVSSLQMDAENEKADCPVYSSESY